MDLHDTMAKKHEKGTVLSTKTKTIPQNKTEKRETNHISLDFNILQPYTKVFKE